MTISVKKKKKTENPLRGQSPYEMIDKAASPGGNTSGVQNPEQQHNDTSAGSVIKGVALPGESPYKVPPSNNDLYPNTDYMQNMLDAEKAGDYNTAAYWERMRNEKIANGYGGGYAPTSFYNYNSKYADKIADLRDQWENYEDFSYDPMNDAAYRSLTNVYSKNASDAAANALAQRMAANGGRGSAAADVASNLAYQNKMAGLEAEIPALRELAYQMYLGDKNDLRTSLDDYMYQEQQDYARWNDDLNRRIENQKYQTERADAEYERAKSEEDDKWQRAKEAAEIFGTLTPETAEIFGVDPSMVTMAKAYQDGVLAQGERGLDIEQDKAEKDYDVAKSQIASNEKIASMDNNTKLSIAKLEDNQFYAGLSLDEKLGMADVLLRYFDWKSENFYDGINANLGVYGAVNSDGNVPFTLNPNLFYGGGSGNAGGVTVNPASAGGYTSQNSGVTYSGASGKAPTATVDGAYTQVTQNNRTAGGYVDELTNMMANGQLSEADAINVLHKLLVN